VRYGRSMNKSELQIELLTDRQVARMLNVSRAALRFWRARGGGPQWCRVGERLVRCDLAELQRWIAEQAGVRDER